MQLRCDRDLTRRHRGANVESRWARGRRPTASGLAIITEACIDVKDRACVDVCPVQCIYEFDPAKNVLFSEEEAGSGVIENTHTPNPDADRDLRRQRSCT